MYLIPVMRFTCDELTEAGAHYHLRIALCESDSLGGRVIHREGDASPWTMQAFFSLDDGKGIYGRLLDGCRVVQVPASMLTCPLTGDTHAT